jgi:hypothetical protein
MDFTVRSLIVVFCQSCALEPRDCAGQLVEHPDYGVAVAFASQFCFEFCHRRIIHGRAITGNSPTLVRRSSAPRPPELFSAPREQYYKGGGWSYGG